MEYSQLFNFIPYLYAVNCHSEITSDRHCVVSTLSCNFGELAVAAEKAIVLQWRHRMENCKPHTATHSHAMFQIYQMLAFDHLCRVVPFWVLFFRILPQVAVAPANLPFCTLRPQL